jgi:hypothetical protein
MELDLSIVPLAYLTCYIEEMLQELDDRCKALDTAYQELSRRHAYMVVENESLVVEVNEFYFETSITP